MPKPLLLARPSGLYARFLIPQDLRPRLGQRFVVLPLRRRGDDARLLAHLWAVALSDAFAQMRAGAMVDLNDVLKKQRLDYEIGELALPNGTVLRNVKVDTDEDQARLERLMGSMAGQKAPPNEGPKGQGPKLADAIEIHLGDLERDGLEPRTVLDSKHTLKLFQGLVGNKPVDAISGTDCRQFLDDIRHWPANATKRPEFREKTVKQVVAWARAHNEAVEQGKTDGERLGPSQHSLNKHKQRLSVFLNWVVKNGHIQRSPLEGVRWTKSDEAKTGRPFTQEELADIFAPSAFKPWSEKYPHRFWVPLIALYTGARVNEISQLYVADLEDVSGIYVMRVDKRFPGQKVKSKAGKRLVPLVPALVNLGLRAYVEDVKKVGHARLFPTLPNDGNGFGKQMTKQFGAYLKTLGIGGSGEGMHSFRHHMATYLNRLNVHDGAIRQVVGHEQPADPLRTNYIAPLTLGEKLDILMKVDPGIGLPTYRPGMFDRVLKHTAIVQRRAK